MIDAVLLFVSGSLSHIQNVSEIDALNFKSPHLGLNRKYTHQRL